MVLGHNCIYKAWEMDGMKKRRCGGRRENVITYYSRENL
jgi:hypothetical protein